MYDFPLLGLLLVARPHTNVLAQLANCRHSHWKGLRFWGKDYHEKTANLWECGDQKTKKHPHLLPHLQAKVIRSVGLREAGKAFSRGQDNSFVMLIQTGPLEVTPPGTCTVPSGPVWTERRWGAGDALQDKRPKCSGFFPFCPSARDPRVCRVHSYNAAELTLHSLSPPLSSGSTELRRGRLGPALSQRERRDTCYREACT